MEKNENISRRDALKRMSKTAMAAAAVVMLPNMGALANRLNPNSQYCDPSYTNYADRYTDAPDYRDYSNYNDYKNYNNYQDSK